MEGFGSFLAWLLPGLLLPGWVGAGLLARAARPLDDAAVSKLPRRLRQRPDI